VLTYAISDNVVGGFGKFGDSGPTVAIQRLTMGVCAMAHPTHPVPTPLVLQALYNGCRKHTYIHTKDV